MAGDTDFLVVGFNFAFAVLGGDRLKEFTSSKSAFDLSSLLASYFLGLFMKSYLAA